MIAKACLRQGSFAPGNRGIATTGGRSAPAQRDSHHIRNDLVQIAKDEKAPHAARVSASQAILDRGYGRPASFSTGDNQTFKRAIDMTDDELAAIASGATLHVVK